MEGTSITNKVCAITNAMVAHNQRLLKNRSVNQLSPLRMLKIIVNWENIIVAKVIVRAVATECCKPIR